MAAKLEMAPRSVNKILLACTGLGRVNRGMESHIAMLHAKLSSDHAGIYFLAKGGGKSNSASEWVLPNLYRDHPLAYFLEKYFGVNRYWLENLTFFLALLYKLMLSKIDVIYLGDFPLYNFLFKFRSRFKFKYRLIFFTGAQVVPKYFDSDLDRLHHLTPEYFQLALAQGIPEKNQFIIPHFVEFTGNNLVTEDEKIRLRNQFKLPVNKQIVLTVGALTHAIKRMDYIIEEMAGYTNDYFLLLIGSKDFDTPAIINLANEQLGIGNYAISTVDKLEMEHYYRLADVFVLASEKESFGMVLIEALNEGLPVIAQPYYASDFILEGLATTTTLSKGKLMPAIKKLISEQHEGLRMERKTKIFERFSWQSLASKYHQLFHFSA